ncbi:MAG: rod shape-determining protein [bacterium]|jgi:rod shape-determining protein MreB
MLFPMDIGIDLGTASTLIYVKGKGIVLQEPTVVAIERDSNRILAVGEEAQRMIGRTPGNIVAIRPLQNGVIADYDITEAMLKHFVSKICGKRLFFRPRIMVCIPSGVTTVEKRAVLEATMRAGARKTYLIEEPLAAALGANLDISEPSGNMVVDIGGGTTDIAVLSLGGVVLSESLRIGGDHMDDSIIRYIKRVYNLMIGERTAEEVKITIGTADPDGRRKSAEVRGRDLVTGLPKNIKITSEETFEAMVEPICNIVNGVRLVLEKTPPELAADIMDKGIVMTGGGTLLHGFDRRLAKETGIPINIAEDAISCVARGTGLALDFVEDIKGHVTSLRRAISRQ